MADRVLAVLGVGVVDPTRAIVRGDDLAVLRGEGVFETILVAGGLPVLLGHHLERLARSAAAVAVQAPPADRWRQLVEEAVRCWGEAEGMIRLVCTKGPEGGEPVAFATITALPSATTGQRRDGVSAVTLTLGVAAGLRPAAPWLLGGVKSISYASNMAALRAAERAGAQEVVFVSADDEVLEAPTATVAWLTDEQTLVTPPPTATGILAGTTAGAMLRAAGTAGLRSEVRRAAVEELRRATEAMLLSSVRGVVPLVDLDGAPIGSGQPGPATRRLQSAFHRLAEGGSRGPHRPVHG